MRHPSHPGHRSPRSPKVQDTAQCLQSSAAAAGECRSAHSLNLSGSSQSHLSGESSLTQLNCHFSLIPNKVCGEICSC